MQFHVFSDNRRMQTEHFLIYKFINFLVCCERVQRSLSQEKKIHSNTFVQKTDFNEWKIRMAYRSETFCERWAHVDETIICSFPVTF